VTAVYRTPGGRRRISSAAEFVVHALLPYGQWSLRDGTEVLFSRQYEPLWKRNGDCITRADPMEWVGGIERQEWFYKDGATHTRPGG
jgi:hypothetical protein